MSDSFSIEQAVDELTASPEPEIQAEDTSQAPQTGVQDENPVDQAGTEEAAETPAEADGTDEAPATVAEAPAHWSNEGKAVFAGLTPEAQTAILAEAANAQGVVARKLEETAAERKAAKDERAKFSQAAARIAEAADRAESTFGDRWGKWTPEVWAALAQQDPQKHTALKAQFDADQSVAQQAKAARDETEKQQHADWVDEQREALQTLAPELLDPVEGGKRLEELGAYIARTARAQGVDVDLSKVGALEMSIARKAMLYDQGIAKLAQPKPPVQTRPALKPSGGDGSSPQQRSVAQVQTRFQKTGSIEDAVDLLMERHKP